jgi:NTP pyrophosphatase (non-canonical NTP hydrolase)
MEILLEKPPVATNKPIKPFAEMVKAELAEARAKHGPMLSVHEGYAVILEELDEVWDEVKKKTKERDMPNLLKELIQVGATAQKMAEDVVIPRLNEQKKK